jgi:hypothetical protein
MTTFADIQKAAEGNLSTFIDDATPAGHFGAVTKILGHTTTYLLENKSLTDMSDAVVKGHVVITEDHGKLTAIGYKGAGLIGGSYLGRVESYEKTFAQMV